MHVLYESQTTYALLPLNGGWRDGSDIWVYFLDGDDSVHLALDGSRLEDVPGYQLQRSDCEVVDQETDRILVGGREFESVQCGTVAPDGQHMLYGHNIDSPEVPGGHYDAWILDIGSGERWLATAQLRHCGAATAVRGRRGPRQAAS